ncbi:tubulin epsilon chain isoform X1 [Latimeria chalumnae]|uniref:Tubulin epsilon 1 n=1 Tax=Latimeria chalumnae TaxID=7897 RepID=H3B4K4_LATCH|nr:PREDICTED: tubulin epsilon chain isoform X1 [Latimeria chalumnae]|eukprot:XP_005990949.1 PREDICTED: tubulin epsilon chain isoform X1 [Latimeria chalumnae]
MTQSIVVQVGQCGNQIGCRFWDLALREHASVNKKGIYDEALSSFFRNVDSRRDDATVSGGKISSLKARAVLIDMEEGVVNELLQGPLGELFDSKQLITDVSGSGNNWAVGHKLYGAQYQEQIVENVRRTAEHCDSLQSFFVIHSMGGGTGSGLGTFVLNLLEDEFPEVCRFITSVYPSAEDDVITSPYNSVLAMKELTEHADCVLPIENQSLVDIVNKINQMANSGKPGASLKQSSSTIASNCGGIKGQEKPFDAMNNIVANLLLNLTSSARFEGSLNMDLNEVTMNLVPFPRLHYMVSSLTPLYTLADVNVPPRRLDQMFSDAFSRDHQLIRADPKRSLYLACALMVRGNVHISDLRRNIERLKPSLQFVSWNQEGWKTGLCSVPPVGHSHSLLALANNTCVKPTFIELKERFLKLYKKKAHLHHYLQVDGMEQSCFTEAISSLSSLIEEYNQLDATRGLVMADAPRLSIAT